MEYIQGEKFKDLANNVNIFYRHTHDINKLFENPPKNDFILISHNSDGKVTDNPKRTYDADVRKMPKNLKYWFAQNVDYVHENIESLPIGLENSEWFKHIGKINKMIQKLNDTKNYKNLVYVNHNINTNLSERIKPYNILQGKKWATIQNGQNGSNFDTYLDNIYQHKFTISPEGNGTDTHRLWECLYLKSIPIEKRNINNQFFIDLPICFVDDWQDITEDFLNKEYDRIINTKWNLDKLDFNYWENKILAK
jgi:hypothetical protein